MEREEEENKEVGEYLKWKEKKKKTKKLENT